MLVVFLSQLVAVYDPKLCLSMLKVLTPAQIKAELYKHADSENSKTLLLAVNR